MTDYDAYNLQEAPINYGNCIIIIDMYVLIRTVIYPMISVAITRQPFNKDYQILLQVIKLKLLGKDVFVQKLPMYTKEKLGGLLKLSTNIRLNKSIKSSIQDGTIDGMSGFLYRDYVGKLKKIQLFKYVLMIPQKSGKIFQ